MTKELIGQKSNADRALILIWCLFVINYGLPLLALTLACCCYLLGYTDGRVKEQDGR
jgi:hypothetical protein